MFRGQLQAAERAARHDRWIAWHIAAIPMMKRPPRLADFVDPPKTQHRRKMTGEEIFQAMRQWDARRAQAAAARPTNAPRERRPKRDR